MKINDLIVESQQLDELTAAGIGRGIGKVAKGIGSVAGGVRGAVDAAKVGYKAGRAAVAGGAQPEADPATTAADANAQGPAGTAPAQTQTGAAGTALAKSATAIAGAGTDKKQGDALYAQVKASIGQLDPAGKKKIMQLVQKSLAQKPAVPQQSAADKVKAAQGQATGGAGAMGAMANQLTGQKPNTMANAPVSKTNTAAPAADAPAAAPTAPAKTGGKVAGQVSQTPGAVKKRAARAATKAAPGAGAMGAMANQLTQQNASKINFGNNLSETLAEKIEVQKRKMFESQLASGTVSVFKK